MDNDIWLFLPLRVAELPNLLLDGGKDDFGNPFIIGSIPERLRVNPRTKKALKSAADDGFWGPYS